MEIAFFVIAVIGLLALTSQSASGAAIPGRTQYGVVANPPPQAWSPQPAGNFSVPQVPSQGSNIDGVLFSGGAAIGTAVATGAITSSAAASVAAGGTATFLGMGVATAVPVVGAAIAVAVAIASAIYKAHKARLQGATNENEAVDRYIPVFDSFVKQATDAYNSGQISAGQCAQICQQFDQALYQTFRGFVGHPGTAWSDTAGMAGKCDKSCTVGCCVYFGDLGPVLNNISYVLGFPTSKWGKGDPRISGRTVTVPKVYPSKYSRFTRPLYSITLK